MLTAGCTAGQPTGGDTGPVPDAAPPPGDAGRRAPASTRGRRPTVVLSMVTGFLTGIGVVGVRALRAVPARSGRRPAAGGDGRRAGRRPPRHGAGAAPPGRRGPRRRPPTSTSARVPRPEARPRPRSGARPARGVGLDPRPRRVPWASRGRRSTSARRSAPSSSVRSGSGRADPRALMVAGRGRRRGGHLRRAPHRRRLRARGALPRRPRPPPAAARRCSGRPPATSVGWSSRAPTGCSRSRSALASAPGSWAEPSCSASPGASWREAWPCCSATPRRSARRDARTAAHRHRRGDPGSVRAAGELGHRSAAHHRARLRRHRLGGRPGPQRRPRPGAARAPHRGDRSRDRAGAAVPAACSSPWSWPARWSGGPRAGSRSTPT